LRNGLFAGHGNHGNGKNPTQDNTEADTFHLGAILSFWLQRTSRVSAADFGLPDGLS
jgi:hypothetical protein